MMADEREPFGLPIKQERSEKEEAIKYASAKCVATTKKVEIDALCSKSTDMTGLLYDELSDLWDKAYNSGLRDKEAMYNRIEPKY